MKGRRRSGPPSCAAALHAGPVTSFTGRAERESLVTNGSSAGGGSPNKDLGINLLLEETSISSELLNLHYRTLIVSKAVLIDNPDEQFLGPAHCSLSWQN